MKKLLIAFGLVFAFSLSPVHAQEVPMDNATIVANLKATLIQLLQQLIIELQAQLQAQMVTPTTTNLPLGDLPSATPITNPNDVIRLGGQGLGTLVITSNQVMDNSLVNIGRLDVPVIGLKLEAQNEAETITNIPLNIGGNRFSLDVLQRIYLQDADTGAIIISKPITPNVLVLDGNSYYVRFPVKVTLVPGYPKNLVFKVDTQPSMTNQQAMNFSIDKGSIHGEDEGGTPSFAPSVPIQAYFTVTH